MPADAGVPAVGFGRPVEEFLFVVLYVDEDGFFLKGDLPFSIWRGGVGLSCAARAGSKAVRRERFQRTFTCFFLGDLSGGEVKLGVLFGTILCKMEVKISLIARPFMRKVGVRDEGALFG